MVNQALEKILITKIQNSPQGKITFAEYMNLALYHQQYGYYNSQAIAIGKKGDFFTSASLGEDFGELLAIQLEDMWHKLGCPNPYYLVEMGAGNGDLARDILCYIQTNCEESLIEATKYIIVEQSPQLITLQQEKLAELTQFDLAWESWSDIADNSIEGCFFSNELVDAFPVHLVVKDNDKLQEVYLSLNEDKLGEVKYGFSTELLHQYLELVGIDLNSEEYPPQYRTEINLQALSWMETVANKLQRGYVLTIDYGYTADKYYRPSRNQGTLQCYYQHRRHHNPYVNLGRQDITAHVDFTALQRQGELHNLTTLGFIQQGLFLMALGLGDRLNDLSTGKYDFTEIFKRRDALHQLIDPTGLGNFGVLIQGKNLTESESSLKGLNIPQ